MAMTAAELPRLNVSPSSAKSQFRFCQILFAQSTETAYTLAVFRVCGDLSTNHDDHDDQDRGPFAREKEGRIAGRNYSRRCIKSKLRVYLPYHFQTNVTECVRAS